MGVRLRPAVGADLMDIGALHHRSRLAAYQSFVPVAALTAIPPEALGRWWVERWPHERETHLMTVAERDGRIVGFTYVGPYQDPDDGSDDGSGDGPDHGADQHGADPHGAVPASDLGELYAIHLDPAEQGRGIGQLLMTDALATLHRAGWRQAGLWVYAENAHARRFYERGGWRPGGAERDGAIGTTVARQLYYRRPLP